MILLDDSAIIAYLHNEPGWQLDLADELKLDIRCIRPDAH